VTQFWQSYRLQVVIRNEFSSAIDFAKHQNTVTISLALSHLPIDLVLSVDFKLAAPLLSDVLPNLDLPENKHTKSMNNEARSSSTMDFITKLFAHFSKESPLLFLIESAEWYAFHRMRGD
jgi:hypothetical protein